MTARIYGQAPPRHEKMLVLPWRLRHDNLQTGVQKIQGGTLAVCWWILGSGKFRYSNQEINKQYKKP
jgi:hypothetical protein